LPRQTDATTIRKTFGALSLQGKAAWSNIGEGQLLSETSNRLKCGAGMRTLKTLGYRLSRKKTTGSHTRMVYERTGEDGTTGFLVLDANSEKTTLTASYLLAERKWCGVGNGR
jgi:hypothetical protein